MRGPFQYRSRIVFLAFLNRLRCHSFQTTLCIPIMVLPTLCFGGTATETCLTLVPSIESQEAYAVCTKALSSENPTGSSLVEALINQGVAARYMNLIQQSEDSLERAVELAPENDEALRMLAWTYRRQGKHHAADEIYTRTLKINAHWQGWLSRCVVRSDLKRWEEAISDCKMANAQNTNEDSVYFLSYAQNETKRFEDALETVRRGLSRGLKSARIYHEGTYAAYQSDNKKDAAILLREGLSLFPDDPDLNALKADIGL